VLVPQFYHLHPLWLAIAGSLVGQQRATWTLPAFALLSIGLIYRLTILLTRDQFAGLSAALLLAVNPLHSYMSKFPLSEVPSVFFFLSGLYFLVRLLRGHGSNRLNGGLTVFSFAGLFLTRISGFLHMAPLLGFLGYGLIFVFPRVRRRAVVWCCAGVVAVYGYSVAHGYLFACAYAQMVYDAYLGTDFLNWRPRAILALLLGALLVVYVVLHHYRRALLRGVARLRPWHTQVALLVVVSVLGWSAYTAYRFVSIYSSYAGELQSIHIDPDNSPKLFGIDIVAAALLNLTVLSIVLTPVALGLAFYGVYLMLRRWPSQPQLFLCGALTLFFLALNTIVSVDTRFLYYYARYLLSETVPLLLIAAAVALGPLHRRWPRLALLALLVAATPSLALSYLHTRDTEMKSFYSDVEGVVDVLDGSNVVLIDRAIVPEWRRVTAPLRMSFNVSPFWFERIDLQQGRLDNVLRALAAEHRTVFAITHGDDTLASPYFAPYRTRPIRLNVFFAKWLSIPVGFIVERDTEWTIYRSTEALRNLAGLKQGDSAWSAQQFE
jgi:hypothetical protein